MVVNRKDLTPLCTKFMLSDATNGKANTHPVKAQIQAGCVVKVKAKRGTLVYTLAA